MSQFATCHGFPVGHCPRCDRVPDLIEEERLGEPDIVDRLKDLYRQATVERSHFYVGACVLAAIVEIEKLRAMLEEKRNAV